MKICILHQNKHSSCVVFNIDFENNLPRAQIIRYPHAAMARDFFKPWSLSLNIVEGKDPSVLYVEVWAAVERISRWSKFMFIKVMLEFWYAEIDVCELLTMKCEVKSFQTYAPDNKSQVRPTVVRPP